MLAEQLLSTSLSLSRSPRLVCLSLIALCTSQIHKVRHRPGRHRWRGVGDLAITGPGVGVRLRTSRLARYHPLAGCLAPEGVSCEQSDRCSAIPTMSDRWRVGCRRRRGSGQATRPQPVCFLLLLPVGALRLLLLLQLLLKVSLRFLPRLLLLLPLGSLPLRHLLHIRLRVRPLGSLPLRQLLRLVRLVLNLASTVERLVRVEIGLGLG